MNFVPTPPASGACGTTVTYNSTGTYAYAVPASFGTITIKLWGAGGSGGGAGSVNGTSGGNSSIASLGLVAGGGAFGPSSASGTFGSGGVASGGSINTNGANGTAPGGGFSGSGGAASFGGAGGAGRNTSGNGPNGAAPGGGGVGGTNTGGPGYGGGGGAGAYVEKTFTSVDLVPGSTLSDVVVGAGGVPSATTYMGGSGGAGQVSITCSTTGTPVANDRSILFIDSGAYSTNTNFVFSATGNVGIGTQLPASSAHLTASMMTRFAQIVSQSNQSSIRSLMLTLRAFDHDSSVESRGL